MLPADYYSWTKNNSVTPAAAAAEDDRVGKRERDKVAKFGFLCTSHSLSNQTKTIDNNHNKENNHLACTDIVSH